MLVSLTSVWNAVMASQSFLGWNSAIICSRSCLLFVGSSIVGLILFVFMFVASVVSLGGDGDITTVVDADLGAFWYKATCNLLIKSLSYTLLSAHTSNMRSIFDLMASFLTRVTASTKHFLNVSWNTLAFLRRQFCMTSLAK